MSAASIAKQSEIRFNAQVTVAVPTIADSASDTAIVFESADATVTGVALGDNVIAGPTTALPTDCHFVGCYVSATDTVTFEFRATKNQPVTGANRTFNVTVFDKTS